MKLSAIFSVAEWTKRNLLGFVFNVYIRLLSYSDFTCATDDFPKISENVIFENCIKNLSFEKNQMFDFFKVARTVCSRLHFDLRKHFTQKQFIFKHVVFCIFYQKKRKKRIFFQNTTKSVHNDELYGAPFVK